MCTRSKPSSMDRVLTIYDHPWPGFTPDLLSIVSGCGHIGKRLCAHSPEDGLKAVSLVDKLIDMGAQIILCDPHRAAVIGLGREQKLRGITMSSPDIRAGVSLLIAALSAEGKSTIQNIEQIDRGLPAYRRTFTRTGCRYQKNLEVAVARNPRATDIILNMSPLFVFFAALYLFMAFDPHNKIIIITAPSGAGKLLSPITCWINSRSSVSPSPPLHVSLAAMKSMAWITISSVKKNSTRRSRTRIS